MPDVYTHRLEKRATMLQNALQGRVEMMATAVTPRGQRPPFTEVLSDKDAAAWWLKNFSQPAGQAALARMDPVSRLELHQALSERIQAMGGGMPQEGGF